MTTKHPDDPSDPPVCDEWDCYAEGTEKIVVEGGGLLGYLCFHYTERQERVWTQNRVAKRKPNDEPNTARA